MKNIKIFIFCLLIPCCSWAWNFDTHHVIAEIAYQNLTPKAKRQSLRYIYYLSKYYPASGFAKAGSWADRLRFHDINAFMSWHFIDKPIVRDGVKGHEPSPQNIVWAIHQAEDVLKSTNANKLEKGLFLRFLIHFIADIHQPLHCSTLYSDKFPDGDRGGNLYEVYHDGYRTNLHTVWDRGGNLFDKTITHKRGQYWKSVRRAAKSLQRRFPRRKWVNEIEQTNPEHWANESHDLAEFNAYSVKFGATLPETYLKTVQTISAKQITLAGYRLAYHLNQILG